MTDRMRIFVSYTQPEDGKRIELTITGTIFNVSKPVTFTRSLTIDDPQYDVLKDDPTRQFVIALLLSGFFSTIEINSQREAALTLAEDVDVNQDDLELLIDESIRQLVEVKIHRIEVQAVS